MTATVKLSHASAQVAKLPLSAILNRGTGPAVYLVDGSGALELRPVTVATFTENAALVSAGIQDGDSVVTLGVQKLVAGAQVRADRNPVDQPAARDDPRNKGERTVKRFNLSEWAITHQPLVLFMILVLAAAGAYSYFNLGRAEDPSFTIKTMVVNVAWPGATATEMQTQVADKIEKKLQELPTCCRPRRSYSQPGVAFIQVFLIDQTPPAKVKEL